MWGEEDQKLQLHPLLLPISSLGPRAGPCPTQNTDKAPCAQKGAHTVPGEQEARPSWGQLGSA